jgi:hypothetical protein
MDRQETVVRRTVISINYVFLVFFRIVAVVKGNGVCAAIIRQKCGKGTGQK